METNSYTAWMERWMISIFAFYAWKVHLYVKIYISNVLCSSLPEAFCKMWPILSKYLVGQMRDPVLTLLRNHNLCKMLYFRAQNNCFIFVLFDMETYFQGGESTDKPASAFAGQWSMKEQRILWHVIRMIRTEKKQPIAAVKWSYERQAHNFHHILPRTLLLKRQHQSHKYKTSDKGPASRFFIFELHTALEILVSFCKGITG